MCFLATFAASGVSQVVLGGIQVFITEDTDWKKSTISFAVTAGTWCSGLLSPFMGRLADRYGPRWLMPVGLIIAAVSFFSLAGVHALWQFFAAYILGRAVSNPILIGVVPRTAGVNFFLRRRNIALALLSTFRPIGGAINVQIISLIAIHYGWRAAYRYLGVLSVLLVAPIVLVMRRRPEDIGLLPDGVRQVEPVRARSGAMATGGVRRRGDIRAPEFSWTVREAAGTRAFWLIGAAAAFASLGGSTVGFSLVPYLAEDVGISKGLAAGVLSLATFLAITNLGWGYLSDVISPRLCLGPAMVASGVMVLYLMGVNSLSMALIFALLYGSFSGPTGSLESMMLAQYFGRKSFGAIQGTLFPLQAIMLGLGPSLGSVFREVVGSYSILYTVLAGSFIMAGMFIFLARPPALPARAFAGYAALDE